MNIDIVDLIGVHASILKCVLHHELSSESLGMRSSDVVSVSTHACTYHLSIDLGATSLSVLKLLKDQTSCTLAHDESVATSAERTTGLLWLIIACRQCLHSIETTNTSLADSSLSTTSNNDVSLAQTNQVEGISQCIR